MTYHRRPKDDAWKKVTLASVAELGQDLWLRCDACSHDRIEPPLELAGRTGLDPRTPLLLIAEALRCSRCHAAKAHCWPKPYGNEDRK